MSPLKIGFYNLDSDVFEVKKQFELEKFAVK